MEFLLGGTVLKQSGVHIKKVLSAFTVQRYLSMLCLIVLTRENIFKISVYLECNVLASGCMLSDTVSRE